MALRIIKPQDLQNQDKERIIIYAQAGTGKTRLALSLPKHYGKIAYYAADNGSEFLASISPEKRKRIYVVKPEGTDPVQDFMSFVMQDWKKIDPEIGTLVIDTLTVVCQDAIQFSANSGAMTNEKHFVVGDPSQGGVVLANRGDYMALESLGRGFLDMLFDKQRNMHIIVVQHEDVKLIEGIRAVGGPAVPGRALLEYIPSVFNTVIRLIREQTLIPGASSPESVVIAITEHDGKFVAKLRTHDEKNPNPLARVVLERDPINFWNSYDALFHSQTVTV
jgi:hypothetical protein